MFHVSWLQLIQWYIYTMHILYSINISTFLTYFVCMYYCGATSGIWDISFSLVFQFLLFYLSVCSFKIHNALQRQQQFQIILWYIITLHKWGRIVHGRVVCSSTTQNMTGEYGNVYVSFTSSEKKLNIYKLLRS